MERSAQEVEAELEASHWWFVVRRQFLSEAVLALGLAKDARILDVGTGTGSNQRLLRDLGFTNVRGIDISEAAIAFCKEKGFENIVRGDVCQMPFEDGSCDLVLATDVVEHVDDDVRALSEIRRVLAPGGRAMVIVPAFMSLWGLQDEVSHHKRRYRMGQLEQAMREAGLKSEDAFHFNYLLFGPIWLARQMIRILRVPLKSENQVNNGLMNTTLKAVFGFDARTAGRLRPPFGVSIYSLAAPGQVPTRA